MKIIILKHFRKNFAIKIKLFIVHKTFHRSTFGTNMLKIP